MAYKWGIRTTYQLGWSSKYFHGLIGILRMLDDNPHTTGLYNPQYTLNNQFFFRTKTPRTYPNHTPSQEVLLMEEILHHLTCMKTCKQWDIYHINWCMIFSINSMTGCCLLFSGKRKSSTSRLISSWIWWIATYVPSGKYIDNCIQIT